MDAIIEKLLEVRGPQPGRRSTCQRSHPLAGCIKRASDIFMQQPVLLLQELEAPIKICGMPACAPPAALSPLAAAPPPASCVRPGTRIRCGDGPRQRLILLDHSPHCQPEHTAHTPQPASVSAACRAPSHAHLSPPARARTRSSTRRIFFPPPREPRVRLDQPHLRLLRRVQAAI